MGINFEDKDKGFKKLKKEFSKMKKGFVKVGVLDDSGEEGGVSLASIATFNEFGTSRIPSRPFMAQSFDANIETLQGFIEKEKSKIFEGHGTVDESLKSLGVFFTGKVKEQFDKGSFVPNSEITKKIKGSSKPLIDTGRLKQSINYKVEKG